MPALSGEGLEELAHELRIEGPDAFGREFGPEDQKRPPRHVDCDPGQRLVHRQKAVGVAGQAHLVAERLGERLPERDADVLDRVMVVDVSVAQGAHRNVDQRMARELVEHMVEESDPGRNVGNARAVEIEARLDARLLGLARDCALAHGDLWA